LLNYSSQQQRGAREIGRVDSVDFLAGIQANALIGKGIKTLNGSEGRKNG